METYRIKLEIEIEIEAFTLPDAAEVARDAIYDMEGLGVVVTDVTVIDGRTL